MTKELKPTYGNFTLRGQIVWKDRKGAYREDTGPSGYPYRAISFGVKTSDENIVEVELFQTKFDSVKLQNTETKKLDKEVKYGEHEGELPEGYRLFMPINLGIEQDEEGESIKKKLIPFDAIKYINENLQNGDTVFMFGSPRFSEYEKDGNMNQQVRFEPRGIYKSSIEYGEDGFDAEAVFDQEIVLRNAEKKDDKLIVDAFIITDKKGNFVPHKFYIDINKYKKFAMNVNKLKFGTLLKIQGLINHTVTKQDVQQPEDGWGEAPSKNTIEGVKKELEITKADKPKKEDSEFYSKEDFVKDKPKEEKKDNPFAEENNSDDGDDWGDTSSSNSSEDPFNEDDPFA